MFGSALTFSVTVFVHVCAIVHVAGKGSWCTDLAMSGKEELVDSFNKRSAKCRMDR